MRVNICESLCIDYIIYTYIHIHIYIYSINPINYLYIYTCSQRCLLQVAMITLHSSAPWLPVCLGSLVAFLLLTFSAVVAATLVQHAKLSKRFVLGVSAWPGHRFRSPCFFF